MLTDIIGFVMLVAVCAVISVGGLYYLGLWAYRGDIYGVRIGGGLYIALFFAALILLGVLWNVIGVLLARERKPLKSDAHGGARTATVEELRRRGILK